MAGIDDQHRRAGTEADQDPLARHAERVRIGATSWDGSIRLPHLGEDRGAERSAEFVCTPQATITEIPDEGHQDAQHQAGREPREEGHPRARRDVDGGVRRGGEHHPGCGVDSLKPVSLCSRSEASCAREELSASS